MIVLRSKQPRANMNLAFKVLALFLLSWTVFGQEPKCQQFCPAIYAPVCGSDGKTYDNMCLLEVADCESDGNITKIHDGPCITNKVCPAFCSLIYDPVCGSNGKTYPNPCSLRFADCEFENDKEITLKHNGSCKSREAGCQQFCPAIYAPVCGSDGKTYDNMCLLEVADCHSEENITKVHDGPCITNKVCPAFCSHIYDPVCGSNGKTYPNLCSLRFADCEFENDKEITLKHNGSCKSEEPGCQQFCSAIYAPVCGSDGKTYDNMCLLKVADCESEENITKVHDGPCITSKVCPAFCPNDYDPMCGSNGKTYSNLCSLRFADCEFENDKEITLKHNGSCKSKESDCQQFCPTIYAPVCGSDGKTYDNMCLLEVADCESEENVTKVHDGPCKPSCQKACPLIYAPVCGSDGKTYDNICALEVADCQSEENITKVHDGPCKAKCPIACPKIYAPVCGSDGKTYNNTCLLEVAACESEENITKVHDGPCRTKTLGTTCLRKCPKILSPVCGSNDKTYPNECALKIAICISHGRISKAHNGRCITNKVCPAFCPNKYDPVCGSNGKTYPNLCSLRFADCEFENDEEITLKHKGPCKGKGTTCLRKCPKILSPVCGSNNKTYPNECALNIAICISHGRISKAHNGRCITNKVCPAFCPNNLDPVCGSNGKTYPNLCSLRFADCEFENDEEITLKYDGSCKRKEAR